MSKAQAVRWGAGGNEACTTASRPPPAAAAWTAVPPPQVSLPYLFHVDGIRAVAVLAVVLHNLQVPGFGGGYVGVDVSLVISGFLITRQLLAELHSTNTLSLPAFYGRRVRRLAPAMLVTLKDALAALAIASNIRFWAGVDYFAAASSSRPLLHTWSLSVAEQFYLVWPAVLCGAWRVGWRSARALSLLVTGVGAASFAVNFVCGHCLPAWLPFASPLPQADRTDCKATLFYLLPFRVYEFAIGGLLAAMALWCDADASECNRLQLLQQGPPPTLLLPKLAVPRTTGGGGVVASGGGGGGPIDAEAFHIEAVRPAQPCAGCCGAAGRAWHDAAFIAGAACIVAVTVCFDSTMLFPALPGLLPCAGAALLIASGGHSRLRGALTNRPAVWLGTISYSLYLVHWPLIACTTYVVGRVPRASSAKAALGAASLAGAVLLHACIEKPCRRPKPGMLLRVAGAGVAVAIASALFATHEGRPWPLSGARFPTQVTLPSGVVILPVASADDFQRQFYGGAGYRKRGVYGQSPVDVILVGDSHGLAYAHGLDAEMGPTTPYNVSFHMLAGTSMLWMPNYVRDLPAGHDWGAALASRLEKLTDVMRRAPEPKPAVVVGQAWLNQIGAIDEVATRGRPKVAPRGHLIDGAGQKLTRRAGVADIVDGLVQLKQLASIDTLVVLGMVPPLPISDLYDRLTRPTQIGRHIGFNVHGFKCHAPSIAFNEAMREAANRTGAFTFMDPVPALQTRGEQCAAVDDTHTLLFSDGGHLSKAGSRAVLKHYASELGALLRGRGV